MSSGSSWTGHLLSVTAGAPFPSPTECHRTFYHKICYEEDGIRIPGSGTLAEADSRTCCLPRERTCAWKEADHHWRLSTQRARRLGISKEESTGHLGNLIHLATRRIAIEHAILRTVPTADRVRSRTGTTPAERRDHSSCVVFASDGELQRIQRQNQTQVISGQGQPVVTAACHYRVSLM